MALVSFSPSWLPNIQQYGTTATPSFTGIAVTTSVGQLATILRVPKAGSLDKFEFLNGTPCTVPSNGLRCSFQSVSFVTGDPSGTEDQFRVVTATVATNTWCVPGILTDDGTDSGNRRVVSRGDIVCCVVKFESLNAGDSVQVFSVPDVTVGAAGLSHFPYLDWFFGASWNKTRDTIPVALKYMDGTYAFTGGQVSVFSAATGRPYNTSTQRGIRFTVPAPIGIGAAWVRISATGNWSLVLYDASDGVLAQVDNDSDVDTNVSSPGGHFVWFSSDIALAANTVYRLVASPTSATNIITYDFTVNTNAILGALETGTTWYGTSRPAGGSWTDVDTNVAIMGVLVTQVDDGTSTGGSTVVKPPQRTVIRGSRPIRSLY